MGTIKKSNKTTEIKFSKRNCCLQWFVWFDLDSDSIWIHVCAFS